MASVYLTSKIYVDEKQANEQKAAKQKTMAKRSVAPRAHLLGDSLHRLVLIHELVALVFQSLGHC